MPMRRQFCGTVERGYCTCSGVFFSQMLPVRCTLSFQLLILCNYNYRSYQNWHIGQSAGDNASWMYLLCLTDWDTAGFYSWGSAVLAFLYRQLCEACRRTSQNRSIGGCVYLLQIWMWSRIPVGRPMVLDWRQWFNVADPRLRPTFTYLWDQVTVNYARVARPYMEYGNELDILTHSMVSNLSVIQMQELHV